MPAVTGVIPQIPRPTAVTLVHAACVMLRRRTRARRRTHRLIASHSAMRNTVRGNDSTVRIVTATRPIFRSGGRSVRRGRRNTFRLAAVRARPVTTGVVLLGATWISRIAAVAIRDQVFELAGELPLGLTSTERRS